MKIVVLDGYTLNPGDLSWSGLEELGELTVYDRTSQSDVVSRAKGATALFTNKVPITEEILNQLPELWYIGVLATGYNVVDVKACHARNIVVTNIPEYGTAAVVQMTWAHIFNLTNRVASHADGVRKGDWYACKDFCYWETQQLTLGDMTLGLIGFGKIAQGVASIAQCLGMRVRAFTRTPCTVPGVEFVSRETLFRESDLISLHCPQTPETEKLICAENIALMKSGALLINTSRGGLIDEPALAEALNAERIAGAGLDVLSIEPPPKNNPLFTARNCFITPHIAWAGITARRTLMRQASENLKQFLSGTPINCV